MSKENIPELRGIQPTIWFKEGYSTMNRGFLNLHLPLVGVATLYQFLVLLPAACYAGLTMLYAKPSTETYLTVLPVIIAAFVFAFWRNRTFVLPLMIFFKVARMLKERRRLRAEKQKQLAK